VSRVHFNDKGALGSVVGNVGGIPYETLKPSPPTDVEDDLLQATHAILHQNGDQLAELERTWLGGPGIPLIILRVSVGNKIGLQHAEHGVWAHKRQGTSAYVLCARNQEQVLEGDMDAAKRVLGAFYAMTPAEAEAVRSERLEDCPAALRLLFGRPQTPCAVLSALSILCQGHLAVQAGQSGLVEIPDPSGEIAQALKIMGWGEVLRSEEAKQCLDPRLTSSECAGRNQLREEVSQPAFWNVFSKDQAHPSPYSARILEAALQEWKQAASCEGDLTPVRELIRRIQDVGAIEPASLVAKAYIELAKKLRSGGCG
jgi:hypothetical protein